MLSLHMAKLCHILSTSWCQPSWCQPSWCECLCDVKSTIMTRIHDMCVMLRRCQRKAKGEVPMLDSFKLLPARAVLADSLIVDN